MPRDYNPPGEDCSHCGNIGWVFVADAYAERMHPVPTAVQAKYLDTDLQLLAARVGAARAAAADSVYPCKRCNTDLFYRWAGGHLDSKHDRGSCDECCDLAGRRPRRRPAPAPDAVGTDRKDLF